MTIESDIHRNVFDKHVLHGKIKLRQSTHSGGYEIIPIFFSTLEKWTLFNSCTVIG